MIDSVVFIGAVIIAVTAAIKDLAPKVSGWVTIFIAALLGLLVALLDTHIGIADISVAQGILTGLSAAGVHTVARQIG
jgi:hypothetical protein